MKDKTLMNQNIILWIRLLWLGKKFLAYSFKKLLKKNRFDGWDVFYTL